MQRDSLDPGDRPRLPDEAIASLVERGRAAHADLDPPPGVEEFIAERA